jgi:hypothetical protein
LKCLFTEEEISEKSKRLAQNCKERSEYEEAKKATVSDFKSKIDGLSAHISLLSNHINNGYEYRDVECEVRMNVPAVGSKTIIRKDTGEIVTIEAMRPEEMQEDLPLEE